MAGVVFFAEAGLEARLRLEAEGLAEVAADFLLSEVFNFDFNNALGKGSVFKEAVAGFGSDDEAGAGGGMFFAASCQFG